MVLNSFNHQDQRQCIDKLSWLIYSENATCTLCPITLMWSLVLILKGLICLMKYVCSFVLVVLSQRTHGAIITPLWHQNDVATSFWRNNNLLLRHVSVRMVTLSASGPVIFTHTLLDCHTATGTIKLQWFNYADIDLTTPTVCVVLLDKTKTTFSRKAWLYFKISHK